MVEGRLGYPVGFVRWGGLGGVGEVGWVNSAQHLYHMTRPLFQDISALFSEDDLGTLKMV